MIGNVLKVIAALVIGYLMGFLCGGVLGILVGIVPSFLFREIVFSDQSILMSILLSIILGGLLGYVEVRIFNKMFDGDNNLFLGSFLGAVIGLIWVFITNSILRVPRSETFLPEFHTIAMIYGGVIGSRIGALIFSIFGVVQAVREIVNSSKVVENFN